MGTDVLDELEAGDASILDALYDDGDRGLDDAQQATLASWRGVRGVVRQAREQGFDVEPPAAGTRGSMETLMAAARARGSTPKPGLWARLMAWMAPIVAHPAMAGAAALVVVGGAAGVLYLKGQGKVVRPPAAEHRPQPARAEAQLASPSTDGDFHDALHEHVPADRPGPSTGASDTDHERGEEGQAGGKPNGVGHGAAHAHATGSKPVPKPDVTTEVRPPEEPPPGGFRTPVDQTLEESANAEDDQVGGGEAASPPAIEPPPPPPPPPPVKVARPTSRPAQIASDDEGSVAPLPAAHAQAVKLTGDARVAAKAGDCATVNARSRQVADLDPAYHRDVFVRDPDIAKCR